MSCTAVNGPKHMCKGLRIKYCDMCTGCSIKNTHNGRFIFSDVVIVGLKKCFAWFLKTQLNNVTDGNTRRMVSLSCFLSLDNKNRKDP